MMKCQFYARGKCNRGDACVFAHVDQAEIERQKKARAAAKAEPKTEPKAKAKAKAKATAVAPKAVPTASE